MNYKDRNGNITVCSTSQDKLLTMMYGTLAGRAILKLLTKPALSKTMSKFLNTKMSSLLIDSFIKKNKIIVSDYVPCRYSSYNDFFTRKIRYDKRPICRDSSVLISPSDGKVSVYPINYKSVFKIKNSNYTIASLLKDETLGKSYNGGYCIIIRLTVDNYHRYCYAVSGRKSENVVIPGVLHTVNPAALEHIKIYSENSREYTVINSTHFGKVVQMEIGALIVGKITNHHGSQTIVKGQEKGYFEFGGSSIVLLIQRDHAEIDRDLIKNTADGYETYVKMGEQLGRVVID